MEGCKKRVCCMDVVVHVDVVRKAVIKCVTGRCETELMESM